MFQTVVRAASLSVVFAFLPVSEAFGHCFVGARFLPATLITDDPCIAHEMSLPTNTYLGTPGTPAGQEVDIEGDISKRITADFGVRPTPGNT
jgi:hypothetical protein